MQRISTSSAVPNMFGEGKPGFRDGNLVTGDVPTSLNADWFNQFQEEICNVVEASGVVLSASSKTQLLDALRSAGIFQTVPQINAATVLGASAMGQVIWCAGSSAYAVTLPAVATVREGAILRFWSSNTADITITRATTDSIQVSTNVVSSMSVGPGDSLTLMASPTAGVWIATGGTAQMFASRAFRSLRAANGHQVLPSGALHQWGTAMTSVSGGVAVTFPIAFPNFCSGVIPGCVASVTGVFSCVNSQTLTGFNVDGWSSNTSRSNFNVTWDAYGF